MPIVKTKDLAQSFVRVHNAAYVTIPKKEDANPYISVWLVNSGPYDAEQFIGRMDFAIYPSAWNDTFQLHEPLAVTGHDSGFPVNHLPEFARSSVSSDSHA
jgi:hypothetical protein